MLRQLDSAVPSGMPVHVLCDRRLDSRDPWRPITDLGWYPDSPHITFRSADGPRRVHVQTLGASRAYSD